MKRNKIIVFGVLVFAAVALCGCSSKNLSAANITRDDARTGGTISFVYDSDKKTVYIGGKDEIVQFYDANEVLSLSKGNRVGVKVFAPNEKLDLSTAKLEMNGVVYSSGDFLESENNEKLRFFNLFPTFSAKHKNVNFKVTWQEGTKPQEYKLQIVEGTKFMTEDGKLE